MKTLTQELLDGLKNADDIKAFLDLHEQDFLSQSLIDYLNELMNEKNITVAQVAKNSGIGEYVYKILNREFPDAVMNRYSWHYKYPLDIEKMRIAAKAFIGEHDFIGFASSGFSVKTTVREIYSLDVDKNGDIITIDVVGNGFLYNMVRIIAGTLVFVGGGKINPNDMTDIINSKDRERAGITAPPQGLCLKEVYY